MTLESFKRWIKKNLNAVGIECTRIRSSHETFARNSLEGILQHAKKVGLSPKTIIDVGAADGIFAKRCSKIFLDAKYILLEPLQENEPFLKVVTKSIPGAEFMMAAANAKSGNVIINVHPDLVGSSMYLEEESSEVNGFPKIVQGITLDCLLNGEKISPPFLLKIDVQGAELDVLSGAEKILLDTEFIILEVSFFRFFKGGPQFYDVVLLMKSMGFVAYDIFGLKYRPLDNALSQCDIVFVKETGLFREHHYYATREQRQELDRIYDLAWKDKGRALNA
jgi:FkbM family methyltransferase